MVWVVSLSSDKVIPARLTPPPRYSRWAFAVCMSLVTSSWPRTHTALYLPTLPRRAAPPCISGRTSYLRVRLAFHPYPQLLPWFCNTSGCEPRRIVTSASLWPWVAHTVSGPIAATCHQRAGGCALFRLGFPPAPLLCGEVNLRQRRCTRRIILQKARHQPAHGACSGRPQLPGTRSPACHGMGL